jgi:ABC-type sugar transport system permease subunit
MSALRIDWRLLRIWSWFAVLPSIPFLVNPCVFRWPDEPCPTRMEQLLVSFPYILAAIATVPSRDLYRTKTIRRWSGLVLTLSAVAAIVSSSLLRGLPAAFVESPDFYWSYLIFLLFVLPVFLVPLAVITTKREPGT